MSAKLPHQHRYNFSFYYAPKSILLIALSIALCACKSPSLPSLPSMPEIPILNRTKTAEQPVDSQTTPRELLTARLVNETPDDATPPITVGKLIEFADRYLACDCSDKRFVKSWERTSDGYLLTTNSGAIEQIGRAVCREEVQSGAIERT